MIRRGPLALAVAGSALLAVPAAAQQGAPDSEGGRFTFHRTEQGYMRLDGRTGQVSTCAQAGPRWLCQAVADDRAAFEAEIDRLQHENTALKKELLTHNLPLPSGVLPDPVAPKGQPRTEPPQLRSEPPQTRSEQPKNAPTLRLPSDPELDRMMSFLEKVWRRLVEMIVNTQKDLMRKT